jgi:arginyl-tRNA--protein-N-Asp/Glu arginylyltransferase
MKFFSSEVAHNYGTYTFAYAQYAELESGDRLSEAYTKGYLPYSGSKGVQHMLYMARSARVDLKNFHLTSENRRIAKKFDGRFSKERTALAVFDADGEFYTFCLNYFKNRHGSATMPRERFEHILQSGFISHIVTYRFEGTVVAYVFEMREGDSAHYWFSFYDLSLVQQSLGLWLMLDCIRDAHADGLSYYYLGTVYGEKALYKTNFEPLEWWDGKSWQRDIKLLRERGRSDGDRIVHLMDTWKKHEHFFKSH